MTFLSVSLAKLVNATVHATGSGGQTTQGSIPGGGWFAN